VKPFRLTFQWTKILICTDIKTSSTGGLRSTEQMDVVPASPHCPPRFHSWPSTGSYRGWRETRPSRQVNALLARRVSTTAAINAACDAGF